MKDERSRGIEKAMTDIFISYVREDGEIAKALAKALADQGWSVWWDQHIPSGRRFHDVIQRELTVARCVIALWSAAALGSPWVREEAQDGLDRNILVPAKIETVQLPIGFRTIQTADLSDWKGNPAHPGFVKLVEDIRAVLGEASPQKSIDIESDQPSERATANAQVSPPAGKPVIKRWGPYLALLGIVTALGLGYALLQDYEWPIKYRPGQTFRDCDICPEMVVVPGGEFMMGSPEDEEGHFSDETPQHPVTIGQSFAVGKYEITCGEYAHFAEVPRVSPGVTMRTDEDSCDPWADGWWKKDTSSWRNPGFSRAVTTQPEVGSWRNPGFPQTDDHPVVCVSWDDAMKYVEWLSKKTKKEYRLLTEAEWEYAARARTTAARFWGDSADQGCPYANAADMTAEVALRHPPLGPEKLVEKGKTAANCRDGYIYTAPVGTFRPNKFGLYDMLGNVWEWVGDCWHDRYAGAPPDGSAWTSGNDCFRGVLRGCSWTDYPRYCRSAMRFRYSPASRDDHNGFRVARTLD